jgi:hypothetical protein
MTTNSIFRRFCADRPTSEVVWLFSLRAGNFYCILAPFRNLRARVRAAGDGAIPTESE